DYVLLKDADFKRVAVKATKIVQIEDFVPQDEIDVAYFDRPYYLTPNKAGEKGYVLLRKVLEKTRKVGIAKVVIRTREYLCALLPRGTALVLMLLRFKQELLDTADMDLPDQEPKSYGVTPKEIALAEQLVGAMTTTWKPEKYVDDYRDALLAWIEKKAERGETAAVEEEEEAEQPAPPNINLMDVLKKSVQQRRGPGHARALEKHPQRRKRA